MKKIHRRKMMVGLVGIGAARPSPRGPLHRRGRHAR